MVRAGLRGAFVLAFVSLRSAASPSTSPFLELFRISKIVAYAYQYLLIKTRSIIKEIMGFVKVILWGFVSPRRLPRQIFETSLR